MSHIRALHTASAEKPISIRPAIVRVGFGLAVLTALTAFAVRASAQVAPGTGAIETHPRVSAMALLPTSVAHAPSSVASSPALSTSFAAVPFAVGEALSYKVTFGGIPAGSAHMRVDGIEIVRNRPAYHVVFVIDGGVPFFRVHDRYDSWIDVQTLASLRHRQDISEGRYKRSTVYEIFPERAVFQKDDEAVEASVANPLDDGSFIYAVRSERIRAGETRRDDRYFRPDRNPVVLTGLGQDTVTVSAGTFATTVVRPSIKANGLFSENGDAQIWFSDDTSRYPIKVRTKFSRFSLTLALQTLTVGDASANRRLLAEAITAK